MLKPAGLVTVLPYLLTIAACAAPVTEDAATPPTSTVISLSDGETALREAFNENSDRPQLLVILSPT